MYAVETRIGLRLLELVEKHSGYYNDNMNMTDDEAINDLVDRFADWLVQKFDDELIL